MGLIQIVNLEEDFWNLNQEIKYMSPFKQFYDSDLSKNKQYSSRIMWAIYLYTDPDSRFARMSEEDKREEIKYNYLDEQFNWEDETVKNLISAYQDKLLSKLQKSYLRLLRKLDDRDNFIAKTPYNEKNAKTLDTMFANSSDIYKQLTEIESQLSEEKKSGQIKGGRKESLSERKIL
jgi:hypothetical protein